MMRPPNEPLNLSVKKPNEAALYNTVQYTRINADTRPQRTRRQITGGLTWTDLSSM